MLGAPAYAQGAVLKRIQIESGGNPNAINLTDSNAKAGHPSQGLMQTIPGTFNAYAGPFRSRGITDPLASIYAGVNYAMHRYGGNWINVMTRPGGYAKGGYAQFGETAWVGERGAELMQVTKQGTRIFSHEDSVKMAKATASSCPATRRAPSSTLRTGSTGTGSASRTPRMRWRAPGAATRVWPRPRSG
jgi:SLT domain-containing protein